MTRLLNRHQFHYPTGVDSSEPRYPYRDFDRELAANGQALNQRLADQAAAFGVGDIPVTPEMAARALPQVEAMARAEAGDMVYDSGDGSGATPMLGGVERYRDQVAATRQSREARVAATPSYQRKGQASLQGYLNNPLDEAGREAIGTQFWEAPLGGHVRRAVDGFDLFGHQVTPDQARTAEQALAASLAVGIGVPTFLAGVQGLQSDQQTQGTMPL